MLPEDRLQRKTDARAGTICVFAARLTRQPTAMSAAQHPTHHGTHEDAYSRLCTRLCPAANIEGLPIPSIAPFEPRSGVLRWARLALTTVSLGLVVIAE